MEYAAALTKLTAAAQSVDCVGIADFGGTEVKKHIIAKQFNISIENRYSKDNDKESRRSAVWCRTPNYSFWLSRPDPSRPFKIDLAVQAGDEPKSLRNAIEIHGLLATRAAFMVGDLPVQRLLDGKGFRITKNGGVNQDKDPSLLEFTFRCDDPALWIGGGRLVFAPDLDWSLVEYEVEVVPNRPGSVRIPPGTIARGSIRPRRWPGGFVFPEESRNGFYYTDKHDDAMHYKLDDAHFSAAPDSAFKLSAFGLPDSYFEPARSYALSARQVLLVCGVVFLVVAFGVRRYNRTDEK